MQVWFNFSAVMPVVQELWGLTAFQSGTIVAFFHLGYVVAVFFYSFMSDKYNPKYSFVFGALIAGIAGILFSFFADGFWTALILRTLSGIGIAGIYVPGMRLLSEIFPAKERGEAIGIYVGSLVVGSGFSLFISGLLIDSIGWNGVIIVTSISCLLASVIVYRLPLEQVNVQSYKLNFSLLKRVLTKPNLLVNFSYSGHCWELYAMWAWIGPFFVYYFMVQGFDQSQAIQWGNLAGAFVIMFGGIATYMGGKLSDRIGRIKAINLFIFISIACSLSIGWLTWLPIWIIFPLALIYGYTIIADSPIYNTAITEIADPQIVGIALGVQSVMGFSFTIISPMIFGVLLDYYHWGLAFTVLGIFTLLTPLCLYWLSRTPEREKLSS